VGFARHVSLTLLLRIAFVPLALMQAAIVARWLGPGGQGLFAATGAWIATAAMFGTLGLPAAATAFAAADGRRTAALTANARFTGLVAGCATILLLAAIGSAMPAALGPIPLSLLLLAAVALPFTFGSSQFQALLLGRQRVRAFNFMDALERLLLLSGTVLLLPGLGLGVRGLIALTVVLAVVRHSVYHFLLRPDTSRLLPDLPLLRQMATFSAKAYVVALLAFLVLRSDLVLINGMLGAHATGLYSVSVQAADFLLVLPGTIGTLLFPRVAAAGNEESALFTAKVCRHAVLAVGLACLATAAGSWWAIRLIFGEAFLGSAACVWVLLPGVWCMAPQMILSSDLAGRDCPAFVVAIWSIALFVNLGLNLFWLPTLGIVGAAASSSIAYALALALMTRYWLRRFPAVRLRDLFVIRAEELRELGGAARRAFVQAGR